MMLVNGEYKDHIPVADRGFQYGDGLFETVEIRAGQPVFLKQHINRLLKGCLKLHIPAPSPDLIAFEIASLCNKRLNAASAEPSRDCILKIIVTRGPGGRGYRQPDVIEPTRVISLHPYPDYPPVYQSQGINARFCQTRLGLNPSLAGIKHLNRLEQIMARAEWHDPNIQEGIMTDSNGHVIEGTMSNVFYVKNGMLHTPALSQSGVAGIIRGIIIAVAQRNYIDVIERTVGKETLLAADEVFVTNSIIGIWPIKQLENTTYQIGILTRQLQTWLAQLKKEEDGPNV